MSVSRTQTAGWVATAVTLVQWHSALELCDGSNQLRISANPCLQILLLPSAFRTIREGNVFTGVYLSTGDTPGLVRGARGTPDKSRGTYQPRLGVPTRIGLALDSLHRGWYAGLPCSDRVTFHKCLLEKNQNDKEVSSSYTVY